jgi:Transposase
VDFLRTRVSRVAVANPAQVKLIANSMVKTDKRDALTLARLLAVDIVPEVWIPPQHVRELRALIQHRRQLAKAHRAAINRLRSLCHRHHVTPPQARLDSAVACTWWATLPLPAHEQLIVQQNLALLATLNQNLKAIDDQLARLSVSAPGYASMVRLLQLCGERHEPNARTDLAGHTCSVRHTGTRPLNPTKEPGRFPSPHGAVIRNAEAPIMLNIEGATLPLPLADSITLGRPISQGSLTLT